MGQSTSRPEELGTRESRRRTLLFSSSRNDAEIPPNTNSPHPNRLSRAFLTPTSLSQRSRLARAEEEGGSQQRQQQSPTILQRTHSTFRDMMHRSSSQRRRRSTILSHTLSDYQEPELLQDLSSSNEPELNAEQRSLRSEPMMSRLESEPFAAQATAQEDPPRTLQPLRRPHSRLSAFRPDRSLRYLTSPFRRRRSSHGTIDMDGSSNYGDSAIALSRLLSAAAAATAATLMGDNQQALTEVRSLTGATSNQHIGLDDEDGSFESFLSALQSGRIASAMRQSSEAEEGSRENPLNFIRMFQFGAITVNTDDQNPGLRRSTVPIGGVQGASFTRLVPIIIVGIRAIPPDTTSSNIADELPPFIDALTNLRQSLPSTLEDSDYETIDSILRPPQNGTSFRHRRRASMGAFGMSRSRMSDRMDDQRDRRSPDRRLERPVSMSSAASSLGPRPPPVTPASPSPGLSRFGSRIGSPSHSRAASFGANSVPDLQMDPRFSNMLRRPSMGHPPFASRGDTPTMRSMESSEQPLSPFVDPSAARLATHRRSETSPNVHYPRFASGHPRRNGVVEPDNIPTLPRGAFEQSVDDSDDTVDAADADPRRFYPDSRSWIIYVLGGSYPEDHPILTTPSLFTDNPTYEDMMLLSALLGPAKAPVASDEDVQSSGGVYTIERYESDGWGSSSTRDTANALKLIAVAVNGADRVVLEADQRCLVCLGDFEVKESARQLKECKHLFHKECIDQWLTQGRNSCPLCRSTGVPQHEREMNSPASDSRNLPAEDFPV